MVSLIRLMSYVKFHAPTLSEKMTYANSADSDQTAPAEQSDQGIHIFIIPQSILRNNYILTHCILNRLFHTVYWKRTILILGTSDYEIYIFLEKNG